MKSFANWVELYVSNSMNKTILASIIGLLSFSKSTDNIKMAQGALWGILASSDSLSNEQKLLLQTTCKNSDASKHF